MFGFLSFIFIFIFIILILLLSAAAKVVGSIFRTGKRMTEKMTSSSQYTEKESTYQERSSYGSSSQSPARKKNKPRLITLIIMCMQYTVFNFKITAYTTTNHLIFLVFNSSKSLLYKRRNITRNNERISQKKNHFKLQLSIYPIQTHSIFVQLLMVTQAFQKGIS